MKLEQKLMELGVPERKRFDNARTNEFIAHRLSESTTGKVEKK